MKKKNLRKSSYYISTISVLVFLVQSRNANISSDATYSYTYLINNKKKL